jgi:WD40 repeat protein
MANNAAMLLCARLLAAFVFIAATLIAVAQTPSYQWRKTFTPRSSLFAVARSGHVVASCETNETVTIRDLDTMRPLGVINIPSQIRRLRISDDGHLLAVTTWSTSAHSCQVFQLPTRTLLYTYTYFDTTGEISRDGRFLALSDRAGTLRVVDIPTQQIIFQSTVPGSDSFPTFSPDGTDVIVNYSTPDGLFTALFHVGQATPAWTVPYRLNRFSEDGSMIAGYSPHHIELPRLRVYSSIGPVLLYQSAEGSYYSQPLFSLDGRSMFAFTNTSGSGFPRPVPRFAVPGFVNLPLASTYGAPPMASVFALSDGYHFLASSEFYLARGLLPAGVLEPAFGEFQGGRGSAALSPNGQFLALGGDQLRIIDPVSGASLFTVKRSTPGLKFSRSGAVLSSRITFVCGFYAMTPAGPQFITSWAGSTDGEGMCHDISDNDKMVAIGYLSSVESNYSFAGYDVRDLSDGRLRYRYTEAAPSFISFLPTASQILLSSGSTIRIEDYTTGGLIRSFSGVGSVLALTPDRSAAAVISGGTIRFVRLSDGAFIGGSIAPGLPTMNSLSFTSDGQKLLIGASSSLGFGQLQLWTMSGQLLATYDDDIGAGARALIAPDASQFIVSTDEGIVARATLP